MVLGACREAFMLLVTEQAMVMAFLQGLRAVLLALPGACVCLCPLPELTPSIPHEPHATVPALAALSQQCRPLQPTPHFPKYECFTRAELRSFFQPDRCQAGRSFSDPVSQKALGTCLWMRHSAKKSPVLPGWRSRGRRWLEVTSTQGLTLGLKPQYQ